MPVTPLTVAEARAILIADKALDAVGVMGLPLGIISGPEEHEAWAHLVSSALDRISMYEGQQGNT